MNITHCLFHHKQTWQQESIGSSAKYTFQGKEKMKTNAYPTPQACCPGCWHTPGAPRLPGPARPGPAPGLWRVCGRRSPHCIYSAWSPLGHATAKQTARHSCTYTGATAPPKSWTLWAGSILKFPSPFLLVGGSQF